MPKVRNEAYGYIGKDFLNFVDEDGNRINIKGKKVKIIYENHPNVKVEFLEDGIYKRDRETGEIKRAEYFVLPKDDLENMDKLDAPLYVVSRDSKKRITRDTWEECSKVWKSVINEFCKRGEIKIDEKTKNKMYDRVKSSQIRGGRNNG